MLQVFRRNRSSIWLEHVCLGLTASTFACMPLAHFPSALPVGPRACAAHGACCGRCAMHGARCTVHVCACTVRVLACGSASAISSLSLLRASSAEPSVGPIVSTLRWARTCDACTCGCSPGAQLAQGCVQPGRQPGRQAGLQAGVQAGMQPGMQPGVQAGVQAAPRRIRAWPLWSGATGASRG